MTPYCLARSAYFWQHRSPYKSRSCGVQALSPWACSGGFHFTRAPWGKCLLYVVPLLSTSTGPLPKVVLPLTVGHNLRPRPVLGAENRLHRQKLL